MRREGNKAYRKGDKLERKVKESTNNKKKAKEQIKKEEGVIDKNKCNDCHMIYIGETKFTMEKSPTTQKRCGIRQNRKQFNSKTYRTIQT